MVKTLFLLEDPKEIDRVIRDSAQVTGESVFISLSPSASYAFERAHIPYKSLRDYSGGEERYREGLENFRRFERIATIIDKELAHLHNIPTLTPARYAIFNLKILLDVLWTTVHILKTIVDTEQPDHIRLYTVPATFLMRPYAFSNDESVYAEVLNMPGWNIPVEIIRGIDPNVQRYQTQRRKHAFVSRFQTWVTGHDLLFNLGLIVKRAGIGLATMALSHHLFSMDRRPVLIYNSGYNWDDSLAELYRAGMVPVYRIRDENFDKTIKSAEKFDNYREEVCSIFAAHRGMREFDQFLGIDISSFFFERLSQIITRSMQESIIVYPHAREMIRREKIRCLLISVRERAIGHAIVQAAHDEGIPVVSWQHGGAGYCYNPMMPFIEFINSDWHFVFGDNVAASYRSTSEKIGLKREPVFVPMGSSSLDYFRKSEKKLLISRTDKPIVYITTHYLKNIYFISQPYYPAEWDEHLWDIQKQLLDLAKKTPEKQFIIKLHPAHKDKEPLSKYVTDHGITNVEIITSEKTIRELADGAEAMVFDLISTGVLQDLTSDLPVFVYSGLHEIDEEMVLQLKKRAYVYENSQELISALDEYIRTRKVIDYTIDTANSDFIIGYGTDITNNGSTDKVIKKINKILL